MAYRIKQTHKDRLYMVAAENGISQSLADAIVSAYIEDLKNSLKCGESISVPGLFSIATTALRDGHLEVRGTVSSALRQELRQVKSV